MPVNKNDLIGVREAAELLGLSKVTVRNYADKGLIPGAYQYPYGNDGRYQWFFTLDSLNAFGKEITADERPKDRETA